LNQQNRNIIFNPGVQGSSRLAWHNAADPRSSV
jgi:hypothetical protein